MVARESPPEQVFATVAEEPGLLLGVESVSIDHYDSEGGCTVVGVWGKLREIFEVGSRWALDSDSASSVVLRTGSPARFDSYENGWGSVEAQARGLGLRFALASPIFANGRLWGAVFAASSGAAPMPVDAESRIAEFTDLVATAIANTEAQEELVASRARIVASGDETRRRIVRDLHDGAQERLVHTIITLKLAQRAQASRDEETVGALVSAALGHAERTNSDLHELVHGILPGTLTRTGLEAGVKELASSVRTPVSVSVPRARFPAEIEANAYFVIAEALTNVTKHSRAENVDVSAWAENGVLHLEVRDDGVGGARADGSGLRGLRDRVGALGGRLSVQSPPGGGTRLAATLPLGR